MLLKFNTTTRYVVLVLFIILGIHSILSFTHEDYGRATSLTNIASKLMSPGSQDSLEEVPQEYFIPRPNHTAAEGRRANATLLMLARNTEVDTAVESVRELEDRFNSKFRYPWVFLNDLPFSETFKKRIRNVVSGPVEFGIIPRDDWHQPPWIDEARATESRDKMVKANVIYGGSVAYRNMCRFNSGFFYRHELLQKYNWYWRVEPDVHFSCDIDYDPFLYMQDNGKIYGFTITMYEYFATIPTLWDATKNFTRQHPEFVSPDNAMGYMSDNGGETYNGCHFWSNFEIASMDFWRGEAYSAYFDHLDQQGGFYYERWGDAPVHSIAAGLLARKDQIHFFNNIGYEHNPYNHCPRGDDAWQRGRCACSPERSFDYNAYSCMRQWDRIWK